MGNNLSHRFKSRFRRMTDTVDVRRRTIARTIPVFVKFAGND
jgi:hypothetical protein